MALTISYKIKMYNKESLRYEHNPQTLRKGKEAKPLMEIPHFHDEIEIIYSLGHVSLSFTGNTSERLEPGSVYIAFPNQIHFYQSINSEMYMILIVSSSFLFSLTPDLKNFIPVNNVVKDFDDMRIKKTFLTLFETSGKYSEIIQNAIALQIFGLIMQKIQLKPRTETNNITCKLLEYCASNFDKDITLDSVSDNLNINKYYVSKLFNNVIGQSFKDYINYIRVKKSCKLLSDTDVKITEISERCGFGSVRTYNRAFLKFLNTTPQEYRKNLKDLPYNNTPQLSASETEDRA